MDSDSVPIIELKSSAYLQLIKRICGIKTNNEPIFKEFDVFFGEIDILNTTRHIKIKENLRDK